MLSPQEEQIIVALRQISQAIELHSKSLLQEVGLTAPQIAVLRSIASGQNETPGDLAEDLHLSPQTIAGVLNRLEDRQLITREKSRLDRRVIRVRITSEGEVAIANAPQLLRDQFRAGLVMLRDWERSQLLASLQRVASMMNADSLAVEPFLDTVAASKSDAVPPSG